MEIKAEKYNITLTHNELWSIAFNVRSSLYATFKVHWVNHQDSWENHEKERLIILRDMFYALGRPDLYDEIKKEADKIFLEYNKKRGSAN